MVCVWYVYTCVVCTHVHLCTCGVCTCVHVCPCTCVCACVHVCMWVCACVGLCVCVRSVFIYVCTYVYARGGCARVYTWGRTHVCMWGGAHVYARGGVYVCVWGVGGVRGGTASPICRLLLGGRVPTEGTTTPRVLGSVGYGGKTHRPHGTTPATHSGCSRGEHSHHHHHYCRQGGERPSRARCAHLHVLCARFPAPKPRGVPAQPRPTPIPWCVGCTARPRPRACPPHQSIRKVRARCAPGRLRRRRVGALSRQRPRPL